MKKKLCALSLVLAMILCLAACGGDKFTAADFEGKWVAPVDYNEQIKGSLSQAELDEAFGISGSDRFLNVADLTIPELPVVIALNTDGSFAVTLGEESRQLLIDAVANWFTGADLKGLFTELLTGLAEEAGASLEDLYAFYEVDNAVSLMEVFFGMPIDEYMAGFGDMIAAGMDAAVDLSQTFAEGTWEYKSGKILLTDGENAKDELTVNEDGSVLTGRAVVEEYDWDLRFTRR